MGNPDTCHLTLSVFMPHLHRCRIELLIEFPNKHLYVQKLMISKANSTEELMGVPKQKICITYLSTSKF